MTKHLPSLAGLVIVALAPLATSAARAQSNPTYVQFTPAAVKGALYRPDVVDVVSGSPAPHVAVLLIHRTSNFLSHIATSELARRGFLVLAMNPRSDNNEAAVIFEDNALDVKSGGARQLPASVFRLQTLDFPLQT